MNWQDYIPDNPISRALSGIKNLKSDDRFSQFIEDDLGLEWDELNKMNALKMIGSEDASWLRNQPKDMNYNDKVNKYMDITSKYNLVDEDARPEMRQGLIDMGQSTFQGSSDYFQNIYKGE